MKTSTYLLPWNELPPEDKQIDRGFVQGLPTFLATAGFQIVRLDK